MPEVSAVSQATLPSAPRGEPEESKVRGAASQFEALLLSQLLKSVRSGSDGWLGTGDDQAGDTMLEMAQEQFAQVLASQGGLGLAGLVVQGLEPGTATRSR